MQRKRICKNVGICNKANRHETIIINDDNEPFECPECHEPLEEVKEDIMEERSGSRNNKKTGVIALFVIVALIIIGVLVWLFMRGGESSDSNTSVKDVASVVANEPSETQTDSPELAQVKTDSIKLEQEGAVAIQQTEDNKVATDNKDKKSSETNIVSQKNGKLSLSYGSYSGDIKGGYPDGMGRLTYSKSRQINKYDSKGRMADAGDYVIGEFVRGFFVQGKHYDSDGNLIETLMIGVPVSNAYDQK